MERGVFANSVRKRSGTDSSRRETAAIWTPAVQPSVRAVSSSTSVSFSSTPNSAMTAATSASVSRSSASRTSSSCPCARSRYSASWGSVRLAMITRQLEGRRSMNVVKLGAAAEANWKSSITITTGSPSAARSFTIAIATSPSSGSAWESKSVASSPQSGHRRASATVSADQKVAGSASRSSHESQIDASSGRSCSQDPSTTLLPAPGAPTTTVSGTCAPASRASCRRGRGTCRLGSTGGENFVTASSRGVRIPFLCSQVTPDWVTADHPIGPHTADAAVQGNRGEA